MSRLEADGWDVHGVDVDDADLTPRDGNLGVVQAALDRFGRLDAVVPSAGVLEDVIRERQPVKRLREPSEVPNFVAFGSNVCRCKGDTGSKIGGIAA